MSRKLREIRAVRIGDQPFDDPKPIRAPAAALAGPTATLIALTGNLVAAPGDLDPTFGTGGRVTLTPGSLDNQARSVIQQSDGRIVLAGWTDGYEYFGSTQLPE